MTGTNTLAADQSLSIDGGIALDGDLTADYGLTMMRGGIGITAQATLAVQGAVVMGGPAEITMYGSKTAGLATLSIGAAGATLTGGGQIAMEGKGANQIIGSGTLTNFDGIYGVGQIGDASMTLVNQWIISSDGGKKGLVLDTGSNTIVNGGLLAALLGPLTVKSPIYNTGMLDAAGHDALTVKGGVTNNGTIQAGAGAPASVDRAVTGTGLAIIEDEGTMDFRLDGPPERQLRGVCRGCWGSPGPRGFTGAISGIFDQRADLRSTWATSPSSALARPPTAALHLIGRPHRHRRNPYRPHPPHRELRPPLLLSPAATVRDHSRRSDQRPTLGAAAPLRSRGGGSGVRRGDPQERPGPTMRPCSLSLTQ